MARTMQHVTRDQVERGLARVRETVSAAADRAGRDVADVRLLAAVKYVDVASTRAVADAGIVDLAENRLGPLQERQDAADLPTDLRWHFIGRLQSREAPRIAARVQAIHTLCTTSAARRLDAAARDGGLALPELLVQVNVDGDPAKDGIAPSEVERFLVDLPDALTVSGFMAMPAFAADPERSRAAFARLRELRDTLTPRLAGRHELRWLSMGTSQDVAVAVEEGATHVRLGRILYDELE